MNAVPLKSVPVILNTTYLTELGFGIKGLMTFCSPTASEKAEPDTLFPSSSVTIRLLSFWFPLLVR